MKIVFLDSGTLGEGVSFDKLKQFGDFKAFEKTSREETLERIIDVDIIITNKVNISHEHINKVSHLKLVVSAATGTNHIDIESCQKNGIEVKNVSDYSTDSVAQHTFSMLFHLLHSSEYFQNYTRSHEWEKSPFFTHLGRSFSEIKGKTWGIIGLGTIGKKVATIANCFGAKVVYYSSSGLDRSDEFKRVELDLLLKNSDIVSIHAPLNEKTLNLINKTNLNLLKEHAVLLNLGRGGIINEADLAYEFERRNILVGLDVLSEEPLNPNSKINSMLDSERFFLTPHIAWSSTEARELLVQKIGLNIATFLESR